jgi:succinate dehydrogenase / fumarate reductase, iron-sulfur subunit
MNFVLHVWRQSAPGSSGSFELYHAREISPDMSFIEMLSSVNRDLEGSDREPIAFDYDCLEGICGTCCLMINGIAHGPDSGITTCQLHMRRFKDGDHIYIEPWRAKAFPVLKDLVVDRTAFDRIIQAGGYVSVNSGGAPDGNALPVAQREAETAMDAAQCISCGACVAACKNSSAMLFVAAKVAHLSHLPQGKPELYERALNMVRAMDDEGFGNCTNQAECEAVCPKSISIRFIAELNRLFLSASALQK